MSLVIFFTTVEEAARAVGMSWPVFFLQHFVLAFYLVLDSKYEENGRKLKKTLKRVDE